MPDDGSHSQYAAPRRAIACAVGALIALAGAVVWSWVNGGVFHELLRGDVDTPARLRTLKELFLSFGLFAPVAYVMVVTVEVVVAPIPGLMLYAPGGIIFGTFLGGTLALIGNVLGAGIACAITRTIGQNWLSRFFEPEKLEKTQSLIQHRGSWLIFLLRLNPLTSSDLVSYAAGFTRIPIWKVMAATGVGMAPLCYVQAWLAEGLINSFPWLWYPLIGLCAVYVVVVFVTLRRMAFHSDEDKRLE